MSNPRRLLAISGLLADRRGNIAIMFSLLLVPLITAVGASLDYVRAYNARSKMQADLDSALLGAVKSVGTLDNAALKKRIQEWFAAQTDLGSGGYTLEEIDIDTSNNKITATARAMVPTTLLKIAGIDDVGVATSSSVEGPGRAYLDVHIVLDKSASMLLAATSAGQSSLMSSPAKCAFACHTPEGATFSYKGKTYNNVYDLSVAMNIKLRADVSVDAAREVLDLIDTADAAHERIRVGLYTLGKTATQVLSPTFSTSAARTKLNSKTSGMTSATSEDATYFDTSLTALKPMIGTAGDGTTKDAPLKLVLILTDGVQSERNWVLQDNSGIRFPTAKSSLQTVVTPINSKWCKQVKDLDATIGVLYTEYLPMTWDWGYNATLGKTMSRSGFSSIWGGTVASGKSSSTRTAYIPKALEECATSGDLFLQANSAEEIEEGLSSLFKQYLSKVRLTN
jgi:Flp pilus assembly protein TadG